MADDSQFTTSAINQTFTNLFNAQCARTESLVIHEHQELTPAV
jgi:hypothetical protein